MADIKMADTRRVKNQMTRQNVEKEKKKER